MASGKQRTESRRIWQEKRAAELNIRNCSAKEIRRKPMAMSKRQSLKKKAPQEEDRSELQGSLSCVKGKRSAVAVVNGCPVTDRAASGLPAGNCQPNRGTEGLMRKKVRIRIGFRKKRRFYCTIHHSKIKWIFDSSLCTREPLRSWRIVLRVYMLREEQKSMPAYEKPPVLQGRCLPACHTVSTGVV